MWKPIVKRLWQRLPSRLFSFELPKRRTDHVARRHKLVKKHQTTLSDEIEAWIIRLFAGNELRDIGREIEVICASVFPLPPSSAITDRKVIYN